ncbi:hypothetical protein HS125_00690 [bacterium]|nr:hypothetical protein [bacterium]
MLSHRINASLFVLAVCGLFALCAAGGWAGEAKMDEDGIVKGKSEAGIAYMHGGVGVVDRQKMEEKAKAKGFTLKVNCAGTNREYLANVHIVISGSDGDKLLDVTTSGPWLYAKLPAGSYDVTATFNDEKKSFAGVKIDKGMVVLQPRWVLREEPPSH